MSASWKYKHAQKANWAENLHSGGKTRLPLFLKYFQNKSIEVVSGELSDLIDHFHHCDSILTLEKNFKRYLYCNS